MKKEISENEARFKAEAYCSVAERCRVDVMGKLYQWGVPSVWVDGIMDHLEREGYVDHLRYAKAFVRDKYRFNQWGRMKIVQSLRQKHLSSADIHVAMEEIDEEEYSLFLEHLLERKLLGIKAKNSFERNGKLVRYAVSRGYEMDEILNCLKRIGCDGEAFE